jgi:predicted Zn-dependent protease
MLRSWGLSGFLSGVIVLAGCSLNDHQPALSNREAEVLVARYGEIRSPEIRNYLNSIVTKLLSHTPYPVQVKLLNTKNSIAASSGNGEILLSRGFIVTLDSEAELAFVLAHELAHQLLRHNFSAQEGEHTQEEELQADQEALTLMGRAGFETRASLPLLARVAKERPQSDYPTRLTRISSLLNAKNSKVFMIPGITQTRKFLELRHQLRG